MSNKNTYLYKNYLNQFEKEINSNWSLFINAEETINIEELINESSIRLTVQGISLLFSSINNSNQSCKLNRYNECYSKLNIEYQSTIIKSDDQKSFFDNEVIFKAKHIYSMIENKEKTSITLTKIYDAIEKGDSANNFHLYCNNKGPTITLVEDEANNIFGGFTSLSWTSQGGSKNDKFAFLFSVSKSKIISIEHPELAIYDNFNFGPTFGYGNDLRIFNNALSSSFNSSSLKKSYGHSDKDIDEYFFTGSHFFKIKNYEVFELK